MNHFLVAVLTLFAVPFSVGAATFATFVEGTLVPFVDGYVIRLFYALAFLFFILGIARGFFMPDASDEHRAEGKAMAVWGIIALVVLFGLWSIIGMFVQFLRAGV